MEIDFGVIKQSGLEKSYVRKYSSIRKRYNDIRANVLKQKEYLETQQNRSNLLKNPRNKGVISQ